MTAAQSRWLPLDLLLVVLVSVTAVVTTLLSTTVLDVVRLVSSGALIVFVVGYTVLEAVFPRSGALSEEEKLFHPVERAVLAAGLSLVLVPVIGLLVEYSPAELRYEAILVAVGLFTTVAAFLAWLRRLRRPATGDGPESSVTRLITAKVEGWRSVPSRDKVLDVVVLVSLLVATAAVAYVPIHDPGREPYTELTLMTENETEHLIADDYPVTMTQNRTYRTCLVIGNHELQAVEYTIHVVLEQRDGLGTVESSDRETVNRTTLTLDDGETRVLDVPIRAPSGWDEFHVRYRLFKGPGSASGSEGDPYRMVSFPVTVSVTDGGSDPVTSPAPTCPPRSV